jgi:glycosyltransferase involved in cell wall biosynthesis
MAAVIPARPIKVVHVAGIYGEPSVLRPPSESIEHLFSSWGGSMARRIKAASPGLDVEMWGTDPPLVNPSTAVLDGVRATLFPTRSPRPNGYFTAEMWRRVRDYSRRFELVVHCHSVHNIAIPLLAWRLGKSARVVAQHHGDLFPEGKTVRSALKRGIEGRLLKYLHGITYCTGEERDYLLRTVPAERLHFLPVGADYGAVRPLSKDACRKELGLEPKKVYALYVGRFYRLKGVDRILEIRRKIQESHPFEVIFVGGEDDGANDLYREVQASGAPAFTIQRWDRMPLFFGACDFLVHYGFRYRGFDVSCLEALAANRPLVTNYFSFMSEEWGEWGLCVRTEAGLEDACRAMVQSYPTFQKCRETSQPLFSKEAIAQRVVKDVYGLTL